MKKLLALLLALTVVAALAACSSGSTGESDGSGNTVEEVTKAPGPQTIADETSVMKMSFSAPETFESAERFINMLADGTIKEKNVTFNISDDESVTYAYATEGQDMMEAAESQEHETAEYAGKTFMIFNYDGAYQSFTQDGEEVFGVQYTAPEGGREKLDEALSGISFTDNTDTATDDTEIEGVSYTIDNTLPLAAYSTNVIETAAGELTKKTVTWKFGSDYDDLDFRFVVRVYKNTTIEALHKADKEYEDKEVNCVTYSVLVDSNSDAPYEYMTQQGSDVYELRNSGKSSGWGTTRTEESFAAFETFLNTVSFQ